MTATRILLTTLAMLYGRALAADEPARRSFRSTANGNSNWTRRTKASRASGLRGRRHFPTRSWCPAIGRRKALASREII